MKSIPTLNRLIPPLLMIINILHALFYLAIGGITLILVACGAATQITPRDLALISSYSLTLAIPALLLVWFYSRLTQGGLGCRTLRLGWTVSCIYYGLMLWLDVFFFHTSNHSTNWLLNIPTWTLFALSFVASLYAFLLLLDEHSQATRSDSPFELNKP